MAGGTTLPKYIPDTRAMHRNRLGWPHMAVAVHIQYHPRYFQWMPWQLSCPAIPPMPSTSPFRYPATIKRPKKRRPEGAFSTLSGGADGTRTRDPRRDRPVF